MDKTGKTFVIAKANEFIYFGNFYKCQIEVAKGERWEIIHKGGELYSSEKGQSNNRAMQSGLPKIL